MFQGICASCLRKFNIRHFAGLQHAGKIGTLLSRFGTRSLRPLRTRALKNVRCRRLQQHGPAFRARIVIPPHTFDIVPILISKYDAMNNLNSGLLDYRSEVCSEKLCDSI